MARVYRESYSRDGRKWKSPKWYVQVVDADGIRRKHAGFTDKAATLQLAAQLERDAARKKVGLIDKFAEQRTRPLAAHIDQWRASLIDKGGTIQHANLQRSHAKRLFHGCRFLLWSDIVPSKAVAWLADLRRDREDRRGVSIQTSNHYLAAVKAFCRWMVRDGRAPDNPLAHLEGGNVRTDRRHDRRAFTTDELLQLIQAARRGADWRWRVRLKARDETANPAYESFAITGEARAMLYRTGAGTGLRAAELRSLTIGSFTLDAEPPTVTVAAAYAKNRRADTLPIRLELANALRTHFAGRHTDDPAFAVPPSKNTAKMLRRDLADARTAWIEDARTPDERRERAESSFLQYRDAAGRVCDFHALRHSFVTALVQGGANPKDAQQLARHSTITLTMDRYTTMRPVGELSTALAALPDLDTDRAEQTRQRATGTCDAAFRDDAAATSTRGSARQAPSSRPDCASPSASSLLTHDRNSPVRILSSDGTKGVVGEHHGDTDDAPVNIGKLGTCRPRVAAIDTDETGDSGTQKNNSRSASGRFLYCSP